MVECCVSRVFFVAIDEAASTSGALASSLSPEETAATALALALARFGHLVSRRATHTEQDYGDEEAGRCCPLKTESVGADMCSLAICPGNGLEPGRMQLCDNVSGVSIWM